MTTPAPLRCTHCGLTAERLSDAEARNVINAFMSGDLLRCPKCGSDMTGNVDAAITMLREKFESGR